MSLNLSEEEIKRIRSLTKDEDFANEMDILYQRLRALGVAKQEIVAQPKVEAVPIVEVNHLCERCNVNMIRKNQTYCIICTAEIRAALGEVKLTDGRIENQDFYEEKTVNYVKSSNFNNDSERADYMAEQHVIKGNYPNYQIREIKEVDRILTRDEAITHAILNTTNGSVIHSGGVVTNIAESKICLVDEELGVDYAPVKAFRLANQKILLTYKSHVNKDDYKKWLSDEKMPNAQIKFCEIAHETGNSKGIDYEHSHVLIDFGYAFQTRNARFFDFLGIHPNIKKVNSKVHWDRCCNYLAKEDEANAHLKKETNIVSAVWACKSKDEALLTGVKKPGDVMGISMLYDMRPSSGDGYTVNMPTDGWCQQFKDACMDDKEDYRTVYWFCNLRGNRSKTELLKHLVTLDPKRFMICNQIGGMYHFAQTISSAFEKGWTGQVCLINLSRDAETKAIYESIEAVKDGFITNVKYKGGTHVWRRPVVAIMANWFPDIQKLSKDRWHIVEIDDNGDGRIVYKQSLGIDLLPAQTTPRNSLLTFVG